MAIYLGVGQRWYEAAADWLRGRDRVLEAELDRARARYRPGMEAADERIIRELGRQRWREVKKAQGE